MYQMSQNGLRLHNYKEKVKSKTAEGRFTKMTNENTMPQVPSFICVGDLQKLMGISRASAYALVKKNGFPSISVGNRIVIPADLFNDWVNKTAASGRC
jgi:predicted DNA-binding transcriptional regulator AlpA